MVWVWAGFLAFVVLAVTLDLVVFHRKPHEVMMKESLFFCAGWVGLALVFNVIVYFLFASNAPWLANAHHLSGREAAMLFLSGYVVELSLSADNIFVMAIIFSHFGVPAIYQHRVLFWGILGAIVLRAVMIIGGVALIHTFDWIMYVFGAFLIYSALHMLLSKKEADPSKSALIKLMRRFLPVTDGYHGHHFLVRQNKRFFLTPLALALLAVEGADVIFAIDSIPAILAITDVPFLVFTSNIFAILGLRSMYFALSATLKRFHYLNVSLAVLLAVIGIKMLLKDLIEHVPGKTPITLAVIFVILAGGIIASLLKPRPPVDVQG